MSSDGTTPYAKLGNKPSDQAEISTSNRGAGLLDMRILIELQVISMLLTEAFDLKQDLPRLRQDVADSIT